MPTASIYLLVRWFKNYNTVSFFYFCCCALHLSDISVTKRTRSCSILAKVSAPLEAREMATLMCQSLKEIRSSLGKADPCPREHDTAVGRPPPRSHNLHISCFCYLLFSLLFIFLLRPPAFKELAIHRSLQHDEVWVLGQWFTGPVKWLCRQKIAGCKAWELELDTWEIHTHTQRTDFC